MSSVVPLKTCFVSACANVLLLRDRHPLSVHRAAVVAKRTTRASNLANNGGSNYTASTTAIPWRHRHRRNCPAPATPYRRRRTSCSAYYPDFLRKASLLLPLPKLPSRRTDQARRSSIRDEDTTTMAQMASLQHSLDDMVARQSPAPHPHAHIGRGGGPSDAEPRRFAEDVVPSSPSPSQYDDFIETRSTRSASTASRSTNRLSLTLPIAPPTAYPSRPTPVSSTAPSFPPTPLDSPSLMSPVDPNDFITAIAAQERRVLELKEELENAEAELKRVKRQYAMHEATKKKRADRRVELLRPISAGVESQEDAATLRSAELDRRKAILLGQQSQQGTPERGRRRVFRGGHTRTLSLLSPTKPTGAFSVHEDVSEDPERSEIEADSPYVARYAPVTPSLLSKRASWAPRSTAEAAGGVKQIAKGVTHGFWNFVEDLRQATVGEEPITGQGAHLRGNDGGIRSTPSNATNPFNYSGDQETIRASGANSRPRVTSAFDDTPTSLSRPADEGEGETGTSRHTRTLTRSNTDLPKSTKRFSWTPPAVDSYDDGDWANWDSPGWSSPRWSGTTVNGEVIATIPEKHDENDTPLKAKSSKSRLSQQLAAPPSPTTGLKLEELLPPMLNRLPGNIKRVTNDLMKEWERSLSPPSDYGSTPTIAAVVTTGNGGSA